MKLIVGLGNPGKEYEKTRHNVGFLVVDKLADNTSWSLKKSFKGEVAEVQINNQKVLLLKPTTYMNLSGESVRAVADFYKIDLADIIVVHDELDIPFGDILIKKGQGAAGHNGVKSIMEYFGGSKEFTRVRVGIGRPANPEVQVEDWVLGRWGKEEKEKLPVVIEDSVQQVEKQLD